MKALRNFTYGTPPVTYVKGTLLPAGLFDHETIPGTVTGGMDVVGSEVHAALIEAGVISDNDSESLPLEADVQYLNYLVQEGDSARERLRKIQEGANREANVGIPVAPMPGVSQVEAGTKADADAAIAKANAAQPAAPAAPANGGPQS